MGVLISKSDFVGKYAISQPTASTALQSFIDNEEEKILIDLMGAKMYADFKANLTAGPPSSTVHPHPTDPGYSAIYAAFNEDYGSEIFSSKGMINMLLAMLYCEYTKQAGFKNTEFGLIENNPDTGKRAVVGNLFSYYNEGIDSYKAIQEYIQNIHPELFNLTGNTPYNGQEKRYLIAAFG